MSCKGIRETYGLMEWKGHFGGWAAELPQLETIKENGGTITWLVLLV
jgi:hypothetical protein